MGSNVEYKYRQGRANGVKVSRENLKIFDSCKMGKAVAVRAGFERIFGAANRFASRGVREGGWISA